MSSKTVQNRSYEGDTFTNDMGVCAGDVAFHLSFGAWKPASNASSSSLKIIAISTCNNVTRFDTTLEIVRLEGSVDMTSLRFNDDSPQGCIEQPGASSIVLSMSVEETYVVYVSGFDCARGRFALTIEETEKPLDSSFSDVSVVNDLGTLSAFQNVTVVGNTEGALNDMFCVGEADDWGLCEDGSCPGDAVYNFTVAEVVSVTATTCSQLTSFDSYLSVRAAGLNGAVLASNDDDIFCDIQDSQSTVEFVAVPNATYVVQVTGFYCGDEGTFELVLRAEPFTGVDSNATASCADDDAWLSEFGDRCFNLWLLYTTPWLYNNCERLADDGVTEDFIQLYMHNCPQSCGLCDSGGGGGGVDEVEKVPLNVDVEVPSYDWPASLTFDGSTAGLANHRGYPTGDFVVLLHAVDTGTWTFSTCSQHTGFDTVLRVYQYVNSSAVLGGGDLIHHGGGGGGGGDDGYFATDDDAMIASNDDDLDCLYAPSSSTLQGVVLLGGHSYLILVEGYPGESGGVFELLLEGRPGKEEEKEEAPYCSTQDLRFGMCMMQNIPELYELFSREEEASEQEQTEAICRHVDEVADCFPNDCRMEGLEDPEVLQALCAWNDGGRQPCRLLDACSDDAPTTCAMLEELVSEGGCAYGCDGHPVVMLTYANLGCSFDIPDGSSSTTSPTTKPTKKPTKKPTMATTSPARSPTKKSTETPTKVPTEGPLEITLTAKVTFAEELEDGVIEEVSVAIAEKVADEVGVPEEYVKAVMTKAKSRARRLLSVMYDVEITISIPATEVADLAKDNEEIAQLSNKDNSDAMAKNFASSLGSLPALTKANDGVEVEVAVEVEVGNVPGSLAEIVKKAPKPDVVADSSSAETTMASAAAVVCASLALTFNV